MALIRLFPIAIMIAFIALPSGAALAAATVQATDRPAATNVSRPAAEKASSKTRAQLLSKNLKLRNDLRAGAADLRKRLAQMPEGAEKARVKRQLHDVEGSISTIAEMKQMDLLQLQNKMKEQQRMLNMISNIMKTRHESQKSTIQNIR